MEELIKLNSRSREQSQWRQTGQKIKFALKKDELDSKISRLDASTSMLSRLRVAGGLLQDEGQQSSSSRRTEKLTAFLNKLQRYTRCLYFAIADGCATGCHSLHRSKLFLEDRSAPLLRKKPKVSFQIELASLPISAEGNAWHYAHVEVLDNEHIRPATTQSVPSSSFLEHDD